MHEVNYSITNKLIPLHFVTVAKDFRKEKEKFRGELVSLWLKRGQVAGVITWGNDSTFCKSDRYCLLEKSKVAIW